MIDIEKIKSEKGERCWDSIGVFGLGTCELLDEYHHCKNCPVYAQGGRHLLERNISPEMIRDWTEIISRPKESDAADKISVVIFRIADEWLGLNTNVFQEAVVKKFVHFVPARSNEFLHGIVNVNGELLICLSIAKLLNLPVVSFDNEENNHNVYNNLLIIFENNQRYAFPVDDFLGVTVIPAEYRVNPPLTVSKSDSTISGAIINYKNKSISIIDEHKLFKIINRKMVW